MPIGTCSRITLLLQQVPIQHQQPEQNHVLSCALIIGIRAWLQDSWALTRVVLQHMRQQVQGQGGCAWQDPGQWPGTAGRKCQLAEVGPLLCAWASIQVKAAQNSADLAELLDVRGPCKQGC